MQRDELNSLVWLETYKSMITLSIEGFKYAALANGGAAVAILAYLGNVAGKGQLIPDMSIPMIFFCAGIISCGVAMILSYLTQYYMLSDLSKNESAIKAHSFFLWTSLTFFLISLISFGLGSWQAIGRFG